MGAASYNVFNAMTDIIASPGKAFDQIRQHTSWLWWALLSNVLLSLAVYIYFYSWVDFPWLVEETIRSVPAENRAEAADQIRKFMTPGISLMISVAFVLVFSLVIYLLQAVYLHLVNKVTAGAAISFGQWFSFSAWVNFVGIFASISSFVVILMAPNNQLPSTDLQPLSLNALVLHAQPGETWAAWATALSLISLWVVFLTAAGFKRWTGVSSAKSWLIALLPWVLVFGIWAAFNLR